MTVECARCGHRQDEPSDFCDGCRRRDGVAYRAPMRVDVGSLWFDCLYWWQWPIARWLWVWPHVSAPCRFIGPEDEPVIVQRGNWKAVED